jgi:hypothetical protein
MKLAVAFLLVASVAAAADRPTVYVQPTETVDASNSRDKAKNVDFGASITAETCSELGSKLGASNAQTPRKIS